MSTNEKQIAAGVKMATPEDYVDGWEVVTEETKEPRGTSTKPHWLELRHYGYPNGFRDTLSIDARVALKWDGCCHVNLGQGDDPDSYMHVCGGPEAFDRVIALLTEAKRLGQAFFREHSPSEWPLDGEEG